MRHAACGMGRRLAHGAWRMVADGGGRLAAGAALIW
jgi:hypothetical protein